MENTATGNLLFTEIAESKCLNINIQRIKSVFACEFNHTQYDVLSI